ncbi:MULTISPECIES: DUF1462 family protein [unclassified Exiguobacterium]|uniref:DUF1462 family protein n=1 Tax=unclassified Exiguobacterium TaxID=2644629 RepID=UPI001BE72753|nr:MULTISPECIES: DUF1462 family protein [unclassified Exiguobacterium]
MEIKVYGAAVTCPSCVGAPSSEETFSWLQAVLGRKYETELTFVYVDFEHATTRDSWVDALKDDEYFYPLVLLDGEMIDEGYVQLKKVTRAIDLKLNQAAQ